VTILSFWDVINSTYCQRIKDFVDLSVDPKDQPDYLLDVWCDISAMDTEEPSWEALVEVLWRRLLYYDSILWMLDKGYRPSQIARLRIMKARDIKKYKYLQY
jgi:hypothetical protein